MTHNATLHWSDDGEPISTDHDDIYFSSVSGIEESRYVFIDHNYLPDRFRQLKSGESFIIGETGFGTGLNFLTTWRCFDEMAPTDATLHFISVEYAPLTRNDLIKALSIWDSIAPYRDQLIDEYHAIHEGFQRLIFDGGRIVLTLLIGDVHAMLPQLNATIDAWFLDGFAPAKNPEMWNDNLFNAVARLSTPTTTIATFTAAGFVRRGLIAAGFSMKKSEGFGTKREMIHGQFIGHMGPFSRYQLPRYANWFKRDHGIYPHKSSLIIGAGIAGAATAYSLAQRGWNITVLERHSAIAQEGSGNPQGILYLKLSAHRTDQTRLLLEGYGYTLRLLHQLTRHKKLIKGVDWDDCGVLQLEKSEKQRSRQMALAKEFSSSLLHYVDQEDASKIANVEVNASGLYFPQSGWVNPKRLCEALLDHPNIHLITDADIDSLQYDSVNNKWCAKWDNREENGAPKRNKISADIAILANATNAANPDIFPMCAQLPLKNIRGQITLLPATNQERPLKSVICREGYISPALNHHYCIGATFNFDNDSLTTTPDDHATNIEMLNNASSALYESLQLDQIDHNQLGGRAAFRSTANDKMPVVGPIAEHDLFMERFEQISKDARALPDKEVPWIDGLYLNCAHGSRGMITAPILGEQLSAMICNEPYLIEQDLVEACHPNRCWYRQLRYGFTPNER